MNWDECLFVFVMMTYVRSRGPLPPGEGARSAGEGDPTEIFGLPSPGLRPPSPGGRGRTPVVVTVIADYYKLQPDCRKFVRVLKYPHHFGRSSF